MNDAEVKLMDIVQKRRKLLKKRAELTENINHLTRYVGIFYGEEMVKKIINNDKKRTLKQFKNSL